MDCSEEDERQARMVSQLFLKMREVVTVNSPLSAEIIHAFSLSVDVCIKNEALPEVVQLLKRAKALLSISKELLLSTMERDLRKSKNICISCSRGGDGIGRVNSNSEEGAATLDTFSQSRRTAILATAVADRSQLPTFKDVVGNDIVKQALTEAMFDVRFYPEWFETLGLQPCRSILLYGPPGTGKTMIARATARQMEAVFYRLSSSDLISSWSGQSEKMIKELFDVALSLEKSSANEDADAAVLIFIDEVDSLCRERCTQEEESSRRLKTELMVQIERLQRQSRHGRPQVYLLCATNCPWELDAAFLRRFERRICVPLPDETGRLDLLQRLLRVCSVPFVQTIQRSEQFGRFVVHHELVIQKVELSDDLDWSDIVTATVGYSGDDVRCLSRELMFMPFREFKKDAAASLAGKASFGSTGSPVIHLNKQHLEGALKSTRPTVSADMLRKFEQFTQHYGQNA